MNGRKARIHEEVEGLYRLIPLNPFRNTPGVIFDNIPTDALPHIDAIDRVIHHQRAISPGPTGSVERPWYMHPYQDDNLIVLHGTRHVDIYTPHHGRIEHFEVSPERIIKNGQLIYEGGAMLVWPRKVFHRIESLDEGSIAINFAIHYDGLDPNTNFNIYDLDTERGHATVLRKGFEDQTTD